MNTPRPIAGDTSAPDLPPPPLVPQRSRTEALEPTDEFKKAAITLSPRARLMIMSGAGAALLVLLVFGLARLVSRPTAPKPASPPPVAVTPAPTPTPTASAPTPPPTTPKPSPQAQEPSDEPTESPHPRTHHTLGGKKVVLEYDPRPTSPTPPPATAPVPSGEDPATLASAREAYHKGNVKLFSGDTEGAIKLYREALKIYPGYVAGYRGLGLGYEQGGHTQEALQALRTYVRTVPSAHDVEIIKKRIEHLEAVKQ
jgi:tetratricopeptide (TPR) repeat protein